MNYELAAQAGLSFQVLSSYSFKLIKMATIKQGILGGVSGKVGTVVGANWKGINYIRSLPAHVTNPRSDGQLNQRNKFGLVLHFLQPITGFIRVGWKQYAHRQTAFNAAMSYTLRNAITGTYPNYLIDPGKVLVSVGRLTPAVGASATSDDGVINIVWEDNSNVGNAKPTDKAMIAVINVAKSEAVCETAGAARTSGGQDISVPADWDGDEVEVFLGFISEDHKEVSNSVYLGNINVE
jgi:hypothetical protein